MLFVAIMLIRLVVSPLDIKIDGATGDPLSISIIAPCLAFVITYEILSHRPSHDLTAVDWLVILTITALAFVPMEFALTFLFLGLITLGWLWHISGRYW